ncbi:Cytochrome P450 4C1, partial [Papilio machaon]
HRKLLNPAFSQLVVDGFQGVFNSQARRLVKVMETEVGKGPFDHWTYTRRNALETICLTALGVEFSENSVLNSQYEHAVEQMFNVMVERFQKFWLHNDFLYNWSNLKKKQEICLKILHNMSNTVLKTRKAAYLNNQKNGIEASTDTKFKAFLDLLLELSKEKGAFSDLEIREQVDTMIAAGHETSANVLMFTLVMIGSYPEVQKRIFGE